MKPAAALAFLPSVLAAMSAVPNLGTAANNSLFEKWRPHFHFIGPNSWQNDPCAPYYDADTKTYHMFYQYHPQHVQWGNISWGHATSKNMVTWTDAPAKNIANATNLRPLAVTPSSSVSTSKDKLGVFSGGAIPDGNGGWAILYTGVQELPTNWQIQYKPHTENVILATTKDNGMTWDKRDTVPVISSPSSYWNITGWRDPLAVLEADILRATAFINDWPGTAYITMGSGLKGNKNIAGRMLLYHTVVRSPADYLKDITGRNQDPTVKHLTKWEFLGPLFQAEANSSWDGNQGWSGNFGQNFEMSGLLAIYEDSSDTMVWAAHIGIEGIFTAGQPRGLLVLGHVTSDNNTGYGYLQPAAVAVGDWGSTYAYNHFLAPPTTKGGRERRIISAWLSEALNTNANFSGSALGYQGSLVLPREIFIVAVRDVTSSLTLVKQKASWWSTAQRDGKHTVYTAGVRPISEVEQLRDGATYHNVQLDHKSIDNGKLARILDANTTSYELRTTIKFGSSNASAGLVLRASSSSGEHTIVAYDPMAEELSINRNKSSALSFGSGTSSDNAGYIASYEETGKLRLWEVNDQRQALKLTIYVDNSLVEVYANEVFVLATHIYPWATDANGIWAWSDGTDNQFSSIQIWDGLANAWPQRASNTSLPLVYDFGVGDLWDGR